MKGNRQNTTGIPPGLSTSFPSALTGSTYFICNGTLHFYKIFNEFVISESSSLHSDQLVAKYNIGEYPDIARL